MSITLPTIAVSAVIDLNTIVPQSTIDSIPLGYTRITVDQDGRINAFLGEPKALGERWVPGSRFARSPIILWTYQRTNQEYVPNFTNWRDLCFEIQRTGPITTRQLLSELEAANANFSTHKLRKLIEWIKTEGVTA